MDEGRQDQRFDERDTMFARMARRAGTPEYDDYYARRPGLRKADDRIRDLPRLCRPGGRHYHPEISPRADRYFEDILEIQPDEAAVRRWIDALESSTNPTTTVKEMARGLGAVAAGCAPVEPAFVYTHKGRHDADYGHEIHLDHPTALVFLVEMDFDAMQRAPQAETIRESARQYFRAAEISKTVVAVLEARGFQAKSHHDAHYDVILPPLAVRAGLGELGRNNILIADRHGSRVRIGAVTTTMPLEPDRPVSLGADHFCERCRKCAENCPSHALSLGEKEDVRGFSKWPTNVERCYGYWRSVGTDCGICMAVCPFSHRDNWFHQIVRQMVRRAPWTHQMALWFDDRIYGRRWNPRRGAGVQEA
jgi:reductive dehalogenase